MRIHQGNFEKVAHMIAEAGSVCILWAMGVTQHIAGSDTSTAISNLLLSAAITCGPALVLTRCAATTTCREPAITVQCRISSPAISESTIPPFAKSLSRHECVSSSRSGLNNHQMIDAINDGRLKSMYVFGEEMSLVDSNANYVGEALSKLDFFVVQDIFFSETCRFADVVFRPAQAWKKKARLPARNGAFSASTKFWPRSATASRLADHSAIANRLGADWNYAHPSEICAEIASLTPLLAGVTYERLEGYKSLQWPVAADGTDQPLLYTKQFQTPDGKATFFPLAWNEPSDQQDTTYDLHLNNGRLLEHFHEGNMTYKTEGIREKVPSTFVEISPEFAKDRGIQSGSLVELTSRYGVLALARWSPIA